MVLCESSNHTNFLLLWYFLSATITCSWCVLVLTVLQPTCQPWSAENMESREKEAMVLRTQSSLRKGPSGERERVKKNERGGRERPTDNETTMSVALKTHHTFCTTCTGDMYNRKHFGLFSFITQQLAPPEELLEPLWTYSSTASYVSLWAHHGARC